MRKRAPVNGPVRRQPPALQTNAGLGRVHVGARVPALVRNFRGRVLKCGALGMPRSSSYILSIYLSMHIQLYSHRVRMNEINRKPAYTVAELASTRQHQKTGRPSWSAR